MKEKPTPLSPNVDPIDLLNELYLAVLRALQAADRPGTHITKTNELKIAAAVLYATLRRSANFLGHITPPRFIRYR